MKRGEVWWADVDKRRPVVLLSRDEAYSVRAFVIVAPVTTTVRGFSIEVKIGRSEGLPKSGVVSGDWLVTVPKKAFVERIGRLDGAKLLQVDAAVKFALGLDEP